MGHIKFAPYLPKREGRSDGSQIFKKECMAKVYL